MVALEVDVWARREEDMVLDTKVGGRISIVVVFILSAVAMKRQIMVGRSMLMIGSRRTASF